jgi:TRAP-type C4-dicarboxylate transport system substrate-binding protein
MKRKRSQKVTIGITVLVFLALLMSGSPAWAKPAAKPMVLDLATFLPPMQASLVEIKIFFDELEAATNGMVKTRFHYSGAMGKPVDHYELALKGIADISYICIPYTPGTFPSFNIFGLPIHVPKDNAAEIMTKAILEMQKQGYFDKDFANVKLISLDSITPFQFQMAKNPIRSIDDIKDMKLRVTGLYLPKLIQARWARTVFTPAPEVYIALQKGVAEGAVFPWPSMIDFKLYEVTKYVTLWDSAYAPYALIVNKAVWDKLPEDAKKFINENGEQLGIKCAVHWDSYDRKSVDLFKKSGGEIVEFAPDEWEKMGKVFAPIWNEWIKSSEKQRFPAKKQAQDLHNILNRMGVKDPFVGYKP